MSVLVGVLCSCCRRPRARVRDRAWRVELARAHRTGALAPIDASLLASAAVDLRISEIVDMPNVIVTGHCPLSVFD